MSYFKWIFVCFSACISLLDADVIHLKNGRIVKGTVIRETDQHVVFEMEMGLVTYDRSKISKIERTAEGDYNRDQKEKALLFDSDIRNLKRSFAGLYRQKATVSLLAGKSKEIDGRIHRLNHELLGKRQALVKVRKELEPYAVYQGRRVPSRIYTQYSIINSRHNSVMASISSLESELALLQSEKNQADQKTIKSQQKFLGKLTDLSLRCEVLIEQGCPVDALSSIQASLSKQGNVLERQEIPLRRLGNSYIVPVRINGVLIENFILDTGCSEMLLNAAVTQQLGITELDYIGGAMSAIADGSMLEVNRLNLQTVQVGTFSVSNVIAHVPQSTQRADGPLLLGMSFLGHFHFTIDVSSSKLILERIKY